MNKLPVVAAVPNYNMAEQLGELLPQLAQEDYADIFVLDDASTDGSREIVEELDLGVRFIPSEVNRGAGATRNQVLGELAGHEVLIHFIDADTDLLTSRVAEVARDVMPSFLVGFIGGLALNPDGTQNIWNYGPRQCLRSDIGAAIQSKLGDIASDDPERARALRERFGGFLSDWPDPFAEPTRRQIFWNIEQNLIISSHILADVGGFDPELREHEIQDLAIRLHQHRLPRYFDPAIAIQHKEVDVRNYNRQRVMLETELAIAKKHGIRNWILPDGQFKPAL